MECGGVLVIQIAMWHHIPFGPHGSKAIRYAETRPKAPKCLFLGKGKKPGAWPKDIVYNKSSSMSCMVLLRLLIWWVWSSVGSVYVLLWVKEWVVCFICGSMTKWNAGSPLTAVMLQNNVDIWWWAGRVPGMAVMIEVLSCSMRPVNELEGPCSA